MNKPIALGTAALAAVAFAIAGYELGRRHPNALAFDAPASATTAASSARKVLYWHDPMVPNVRFDKPGKSPFMNMQLVPVYADDAGISGVKISPLVQQNLGLRTAAVQREAVAPALTAVGTVQFDERRMVAVQTRVAGYVEQLPVRATMQAVRKGEPLATVFAPDWLAPLNDLVALERSQAAPALIGAARARAQALSIPHDLVQQAERSGQPSARFTLRAPQDGVIAELGVREGVAVNPGMTLFRIAGLDTVWAVAQVPEAQAALLRTGQAVQAYLTADPSVRFEGRLGEILPQVDPNTRTLQARFEVRNRDGRLIPGMLLNLDLRGTATSRLVVPAEAIIRTGARALAIVRNEQGRFEPRQVTLGADLGDRLEVTRGLREGEQVVTSAQFLVDSEANLRSALGHLAPPPSGAASGGQTPAPAASVSGAGPAGMTAVGGATAGKTSPATASRPPSGAGLYRGEGRVESVSADEITISHQAIPALQWPAMTMGFAKADPKAFGEVKPGDTVRFAFREGEAGYVLVEVQRTGGGR